jgi:Ribbon-helix-helix protein, copG family
VLPTRCRRSGPRLTVSLSEADYDRLQPLEEDEVSVSWVIRRAIEDYLRRHSDAGGDRAPRAIPKRERRAV